MNNKTITAAELERINYRSDDTVSFVNGGLINPKAIESELDNIIYSTSDGSIWLKPAGLESSPINLTQVVLNEVQLSNIDKIPAIEGVLENKVDKKVGFGLSENNLSNDLVTKINNADNHIKDSTIHVTASEKANWNKELGMELLWHGADISASPSSASVNSDGWWVIQIAEPSGLGQIVLPVYVTSSEKSSFNFTIAQSSSSVKRWNIEVSGYTFTFTQSVISGDPDLRGWAWARKIVKN